jgi:hypothetical protein
MICASRFTNAAMGGLWRVRRRGRNQRFNSGYQCVICNFNQYKSQLGTKKAEVWANACTSLKELMQASIGKVTRSIREKNTATARWILERCGFEEIIKGEFADMKAGPVSFDDVLRKRAEAGGYKRGGRLGVACQVEGDQPNQRVEVEPELPAIETGEGAQRLGDGGSATPSRCSHVEDGRAEGCFAAEDAVLLGACQIGSSHQLFETLLALGGQILGRVPARSLDGELPRQEIRGGVADSGTDQ